MAAELARGDVGCDLPNQIERLKPCGEQQLGGLYEHADRESGLMAAGAALIALEPAAIDEPMLVAVAARAVKPISHTDLLQGSITLLLGAVEPLALRQGDAFLELNRTTGHDMTSICYQAHGSTPLRAGRNEKSRARE